jgi:hypothetical protein
MDLLLVIPVLSSSCRKRGSAGAAFGSEERLGGDKGRKGTNGNAPPPPVKPGRKSNLHKATKAAEAAALAAQKEEDAKASAGGGVKEFMVAFSEMQAKEKQKDREWQASEKDKDRAHQLELVKALMQ